MDNLIDMELIQNWNIEDKQKLLDHIKNSITVEYIDICVCGSRVFGGFKPTSDIDVVVLVEDCCGIDRVNNYYDGTPNPENTYNDFRINISFKSYDKSCNNVWRSVGVDLTLPQYSLITGELCPGNENHIEYHQGLRQLIIDYRGLNVPLDEYKEENIHLLK